MKERRFVDRVRKIAQETRNGELMIFAYNSYQTLLGFSERCKSGDLEARKLWDELPAKIRDFYPALNYLNQERGQ
jgi:hypothetical protein